MRPGRSGMASCFDLRLSVSSPISSAINGGHSILRLNGGSIMGMRNRLLHEFTVIDSDVVWDTIHNDLPDLERQLREILQNEP